MVSFHALAPVNAVVVLALLVGILTAGCGHDITARDTPFTHEWAYQRQRDRADKPQIDELVLLGDKEGARASVKLDKEGKPYLNFWKKRGISADLDVDHDEVEVGVKFEREWMTRPPRPD